MIDCLLPILAGLGPLLLFVVMDFVGRRAARREWYRMLSRRIAARPSFVVETQLHSTLSKHFTRR